MHIQVSTKKSILTIVVIALSCATAFASQQVDSFYLNILNRGEQYYMEGDYKNAINKLNVAIFGLHSAKEHQAKAYVYLSLSYFYLREKDNSETNLREAEKLMGIEELLALDITDAARNDLERLIYTLKAGNNPVSGLRMLPKLPEENLVSNPNSDQGQLEQSIRENPRTPSAYYSLYNLYRESYNYQGATKTIEDLIKKNPNEMYAYYLLGIIKYQEKDFKDALNSIKNFFELSDGTSIKGSFLDEIIAYQILSTYLRGDRNKVENLISQHAASFTRDKIRALPLSEKDKNMLRGIVDMYLR